MTTTTIQSPPTPIVSTPAPRSGGLVRPTLSLWRREMVRFFRQKNRVVSSVVTPLIFWVLLGSGLSGYAIHSGSNASTATAATAAIGYREYFFPGTVVLMVLNTAIFSTISVIEDRREGFLQAVLVAPIPRLALVLGKVLGGASIAAIQGLVMLLMWPLVFGFPGFGWMAGAVAIMFALALGLTALGLCIAWPMDSTAGFHAIMMIFLMPMWFLSGAVFPITASTPTWLKIVMWCNPLTYGQAAFTEALTAGRISVGAPVPLALSAPITFACTVAVILLASMLVSRPRKDGNP